MEAIEACAKMSISGITVIEGLATYKEVLQ
jgi:hypothetical protein